MEMDNEAAIHQLNNQHVFTYWHQSKIYSEVCLNKVKPIFVLPKRWKLTFSRKRLSLSEYDPWWDCAAGRWTKIVELQKIANTDYLILEK